MSFSFFKVSRGTNEPAGFLTFGFNGLLNINALPQQVADSELTKATNVYGTVDGGLSMRRGMSLRGGQFSNVTQGKNVVRFFQEKVGGAPVIERRFLLGQSGGTLWDVDAGTQIGATNALGGNAKSWTTARIYDPDTAGGTDILVICTGDGGPYLFDGTNITAPASWAAVAAGALYCQVANGTLWFGGIPAQSDFLVQMQIGRPQVYQQGIITSYPVTGLSVLGAGSQSGLVYGMSKGIGLSYGVNATTLYTQEIPHEDGVTAGRAMVAVGAVVYFIGRFNIYMFDGQQIIKIGDNVRPWVVCDPLHPEFPMDGDRHLSFGWYYNDLIMFAYDSGGVGYCNTYLVWHLKQQGWTVYSGPKLSGATLLDAPGDTLPTKCVVMDAIISQAHNWDAYMSDGPMTHSVDDSGVVFTTDVLTKYFRLSGPGTKARLTGIAPELFVEQFEGQIVIASDYGTGTFQELFSRMSPGNALIWEQGNWDQTAWGGNEVLAYAVQNFEIEDSTDVPKSYSFAFGINTKDRNPPYIFAGFSGEFAAEGRNFN